MTRSPIAAAALVILCTLVTLSVTPALSKGPQGQSAPSNTSPPSISGVATVGSTLQANSGSWQGPNISYSFQWQRCSSATSCAMITGATGSSYVVVSGDAGNTLRVVVTAKDKFGSATAASAQTGVVPSPSSTNYTNTARPAITGTAQVGQTLTVSNGSWSPTSSSFQYAWHRCQNGSCVLSPTTSNQNTYVVQAADVGYTLVAQVAPGGVWSASADSSQTAAVTGSGSTPPPPPASGSLAFDGRASNMTTLYSYETTPGDLSTLQHGQSPNIWSCLCFLKNDISLASDGTYGKAYKVAVDTGDTNPWGGSKVTDGAAQMSIRRSNDLGNWDYYAVAVKVPSWSGPMSDLYFSTILSVGYQTSQGDQVALGLYPNSSGQLSFEMHQNSGYANNATGWAAGSVSYKQPFLPVTYGQWQEFVVGVKWATDNTGAVQVYSRTPGGSWSKVFEKLNEPTYLYGTTPSGTFAQDGSNWGTVIDKIGLYYNEYGGESQTIYESGVTRSSDLATAESTFP
jgi:Ig domain of plant-specific actin-binding protein